jgi:probable rRNA maturation factor
MSAKPLNSDKSRAGRATVKTFPRTAGLTAQRFNEATIAISNRQRVRKFSRPRLKQITAALLADLKVEHADLGIHFVAAPEMTRLNEKFLRHQGTTDVITFDYLDNVGQASRLSHSKTPNSGDRQHACPTIHGEIFICVDEAVWQARKFGTSWQSEVIRCLVHGVLHLLGFEDSTARARHKMKREEDRWLRKLSRRFTLSKL